MHHSHDILIFIYNIICNTFGAKSTLDVCRDGLFIAIFCVLHFCGRICLIYTYVITCADPESFVRRGPTLKTIFYVMRGGEGGSEYH